MKASEPIASAYGGKLSIQGLKDKLIASIESINDECKLQECWEFLQNEAMPCRYTEEELDAVVKNAEEEGFASQKAVDALFSRWKH